MNTAHEESPIVIIDVDMTNPGQFFACCGLLELAHRTWGCEAQGRFGEECFLLSVPMEGIRLLPTLLDGLDPIPHDVDDNASALTIRLGTTRPSILLDWWLDHLLVTDNKDKRHGRRRCNRFKTWAANQKSYSNMQRLIEQLGQPQNASSVFKHTARLSNQFSVDSRSAWTSLDAGFSPDQQKLKGTIYPFVELLAAIGLQRFRPLQKRVSAARTLYIYNAWTISLPAPLASTLVYATGTSSHVTPFQFQILNQNKFKYFTSAIQGVQQ